MFSFVFFAGHFFLVQNIDVDSLSDLRKLLTRHRKTYVADVYIEMETEFAAERRRLDFEEIKCP